MAQNETKEVLVRLYGYEVPIQVTKVMGGEQLAHYAIFLNHPVNSKQKGRPLALLGFISPSHNVDAPFTAEAVDYPQTRKWTRKSAEAAFDTLLRMKLQPNGLDSGTQVVFTVKGRHHGTEKLVRGVTTSPLLKLWPANYYGVSVRGVGHLVLAKDVSPL